MVIDPAGSAGTRYLSRSAMSSRSTSRLVHWMVSRRSVRSISRGVSRSAIFCRLASATALSISRSNGVMPRSCAASITWMTSVPSMPPSLNTMSR